MLGELSCLLSSLGWAIAIAWFRGSIAELKPLTVNLGKCLFGTLMLGTTAWLLGDLPALWNAPQQAILLVALSGIAGLSLGDWALFAAVHRLGTHRALLFQTLGPVFAAGLAFAFLGERQSLTQWLGAAAVLAGVAIVLGRGKATTTCQKPRADSLGIAFAVLAALGQGAGIVLAKGGIEAMPVTAASFLRLGAGTLGIVAALVIGRSLKPVVGSLLRTGVPRQLFGPSLLGTYISYLLMMFGIASAPAATAAVLLATTPIFGLFVDAVAVGAKITWRGVLGTCVAVGGVACLVI